MTASRMAGAYYHRDYSRRSIRGGVHGGTFRGQGALGPGNGSSVNSTARLRSNLRSPTRTPSFHAVQNGARAYFKKAAAVQLVRDSSRSSASGATNSD